MNFSLLFEFAEAMYAKYEAFVEKKKKKTKIRLRANLSDYKKAFAEFAGGMTPLSYEDKKLILLLFSAMTHNKAKQKLWNVVRFFHQKVEKQLVLLEKLLSLSHPLYRECWIVVEGGISSENKDSHSLTLDDYLSSLYNPTLILNAIGYGVLMKKFFPHLTHLPLYIKRENYKSFSTFLRDVEVLFSYLKFYKTLVNQSLLSPPFAPWFSIFPFSDMIKMIIDNLDLEAHKDFSAHFPQALSILYTEAFEKNVQPWIFYFYLLYSIFVRGETTLTVDDAIEMLTIVPEEIPLIVSFFHPEAIFYKKKLIRLVAYDIFEEEGEETDEFADPNLIFHKSFEVNKEELLNVGHYFLRSNLEFKEKLLCPSLLEREISTDHEKVDVDALVSAFPREANTSSSRKNATSVITLEQKDVLYEVIKPHINLSKIILDDDVKQELLNAVDMTKTMKVLKKWGVKPSLSQKEASSIKILLYGASGTGKTITAQALAGEAHAKLFKVDAANLVSSFVGESTKNVKQVFEEYYNYVKNSKENVFFFINEADQLLSARGMIHQAADKEYNQMQNLLLEEIENFQGVFIATTNLIELFDVAWNRRFNIKIRFDIPQYETRLKLWKVHISEKMPLSSDVNLERLAEYELAGGSIANVVYNAARKAASRPKNEQIITQKDFLDAIDKEMRSILGYSNKKVGFNR